MDQIAPRLGPRWFWKMFRQSWCALLALAALDAAGHRTYAQEQASRGPSEYEVKAAFLLNFTKFIEWPGASGSADVAFTICILGEDPFGKVLDQIVEDEKVGNRPIAIRRISSSPAGQCEILFVSKSVTSVAPVLTEVGAGVLTVGESDGFLRHGGIIALVVDNRRVRFDVNARAAAAAGLKISSRLLNVARSVEGQVRQ